MNNTIFTVRHGQTDSNFKNIFQGISDVPLNDTGRQQVHETAKKLKNTKFDIIYCSPLSRARETCEIILKENKFGGSPIFDDRIRERSFGILEGTSLVDFIKKHPAGWWRIGEEKKVKGMETIADIFERVHNFLDEINCTYNDKNILIVCHSGVMRSVHFYFNELPADNDLLKAYQADNAAINKYKL